MKPSTSRLTPRTLRPTRKPPKSLSPNLEEAEPRMFCKRKGLEGLKASGGESKPPNPSTPNPEPQSLSLKLHDPKELTSELKAMGPDVVFACVYEQVCHNFIEEPCPPKP